MDSYTLFNHFISGRQQKRSCLRMRKSLKILTRS